MKRTLPRVSTASRCTGPTAWWLHHRAKPEGQDRQRVRISTACCSNFFQAERKGRAQDCTHKASHEVRWHSCRIRWWSWHLSGQLVLRPPDGPGDPSLTTAIGGSSAARSREGQPQRSTSRKLWGSFSKDAERQSCEVDWRAAGVYPIFADRQRQAALDET